MAPFRFQKEAREIISQKIAIKNFKNSTDEGHVICNITTRMLSCFSHVRLCDPMDCIARQAPWPMGFSRLEYWSVLPCLSPRDLPYPGIEPRSLMSPALAGGFFTTSATWEAQNKYSKLLIVGSGHMGVQGTILYAFLYTLNSHNKMLKK